MDSFNNNIERLLTKEIERLIAKDTPMLVEPDAWYGIKAYQCPICHRTVVSGNYCRWCGQRLKYNKEE